MWLLPLLTTVLLNFAFATSETDAPVIEMYPQDQKVLDLGKAVFVCTASGHPAPEFEWLKNGKPALGMRYETFKMPKGSVLRIEPVRPSLDVATYECVAENGVGEPVRAQADLVVLERDSLPSGFPNITKQPDWIPIHTGGVAMLECQAEGEPEPSVRWLKDSIPLDMSNPRYDVQRSSLQISDVKEEDRGEYECIAENTHGSVVSNMAKLWIRERSSFLAPSFATRPEDRYEVMLFGSLNITCVAVGSPMPFVKWRKGPIDITPDHTIPIGRNVLTLTDISESANYTCVAESEAGNIETTAQVVVQDAPVIQMFPQNQTVADLGKAMFVCTAVGHQNPKIKWRKNGKPAIGMRYEIFKIPYGSVLRIEPVRGRRDVGTYECITKNGFGEPVRAQADLVVQERDSLPSGFPRFNQQPDWTPIHRGGEVLLECQVQGDPEPTVTWLKKGIPLNMSNPRYSLVEEPCLLLTRQDNFCKQASLQITDVKEKDRGEYECMAENTHGYAISRMAKIWIRERSSFLPPSFAIRPENLYEVLPGSSLNITCVAVGSPMPSLEWRQGLIDITPDQRIDFGRSVLTLTDISESANYTCVAASEAGNIETTAQVVVQDLPSAPTNVSLSDVTATSVRLSWSYDIGSEHILYYVIQYKPIEADQEHSEIGGITTMFFTIPNLTPATEYEFYVIAVNAFGRGPPSIRVVITTSEPLQV